VLRIPADLVERDLPAALAQIHAVLRADRPSPPSPLSVKRRGGVTSAGTSSASPPSPLSVKRRGGVTSAREASPRHPAIYPPSPDQGEGAGG
jgi:hypothetical protein